MPRLSPCALGALLAVCVGITGSGVAAQKIGGRFGAAPRVGTFEFADVFEPLDRQGTERRALRAGPIQGPADAHLRSWATRRKIAAGDDDLRSLLTLPSVADPNFITPRPLFFDANSDIVLPPDLHAQALSALFFARPVGGRMMPIYRLRPAVMPRVGMPHLWASIGVLIGGGANAYLSGYRLSQFRLRFNPLPSERIALREQGADMVQHLVLGYGLTRYFLDNGSGPVVAGASAFTYEFIVGEVLECFPQAGGISVRDIASDIVAVTVAALDRDFDSPIRFWAGSRTDVTLSNPNEFDPYRISLGIAVGRVAGLEVVCAVQNWKDRINIPLNRDNLDRPATGYYFANR